MSSTETEPVPEALSSVWQAGEALHPALVLPDEGLVVSFGELGDRIEALAGALAGLGVQRADRVCLALGNGIELLELLFATVTLGAAAAPLNPAYTREEFAFYLGDLEPRLLLVPQGGLEAARAAAPDSVRVVDVVTGQGRAAVRQSTASSGFAPGVPGDVALLLHTSGTTGRPKQVPLLQQNLVASARSMVRHYRLSPDDVSYVAMPLFHVHGLVGSTFAALLAGGSVVVPGRLTPNRFREQLEAHRVTWFSAGPTLHHMLLERQPASPSELALRFTRSCSSALSADLLARAEASYGVPMLEAYGMTEASHEMAANPLPPGERRTGSVGVPTGAEVRIVDSTWSESPPEAAGEVVVRGPGLTPGYLANASANADSFRDGWFRTGDQGVIQDGYLRLVGRIKELIIRGGENISPGEIEDVLRRHPAVADAAVFGVPDEKYGEIVAAAVSLRGETSERALVDHCRSYLTAVKLPKVIHILDEIPRTPTGKLQRRHVARAIYGE